MSQAVACLFCQSHFGSGHKCNRPILFGIPSGFFLLETMRKSIWVLRTCLDKFGHLCQNYTDFLELTPLSNETNSARLFHSALRRLLRPLIKVLISRGMIFPAAAELLRELYVDVAANNFLVKEKDRTLSRISLMTGVTRREARRLLEKPKNEEAAPQSLPLGARVMTVWLGDGAYLDQHNEPLPLPLTSLDDAPSLDRLVASVSKDVRARAVLDEWLRLGLVELSDSIVRLKRKAFIPEEGHEEKIYYFGRNLRDHIATSVHNLQGERPSFLDRAVYYDRLSPQSLEALRQFAQDHGNSLLLEINRKARQLADQDAARGGDLSGRMTLGIYYFEEGQQDEAASTEQKP